MVFFKENKLKSDFQLSIYFLFFTVYYNIGCSLCHIVGIEATTMLELLGFGHILVLKRVYFPVPLHLCFRLKRAARQQLWISRRETSLSTSMRFPWVATDKRQSAWWKAPTRPSASWWKGRRSILCICCRHKCITLPSKWVAMAAFPTHEVDWSRAGALLPLHWTDSQSLGYLSGLCGWMVPLTVYTLSDSWSVVTSKVWKRMAGVLVDSRHRCSHCLICVSLRIVT